MLRKLLPVVALAVAVTWMITPYTTPSASAQDASSQTALTDLVQRLMDARLNYGENLHRLVEYYQKTGNSHRGAWARRELKDFRKIHEHDYLPDLKANLIPMDVVDCGESDIVEVLLEHRQEYRNSLESLVQVLSAAKEALLGYRAKRELKDLISANKYLYLRDADTPTSGLRPIDQISHADRQYAQLFALKKDSRGFGVNRYKTQLVLEGLRRLIEDYPTSDKIDDAAFQIAELCTDNLKDYQRAVRWYECVLAWDPQTQLPVNYRIALIYDKHLINRLIALNYYQRSLHEFPRGSSQWKRIQKRINRLRGK
jgi:tetratricopeptide (TPR) repeat protein